jgi:hypothetical protein
MRSLLLPGLLLAVLAASPARAERPAAAARARLVMLEALEAHVPPAHRPPGATVAPDGGASPGAPQLLPGRPGAEPIEGLRLDEIIDRGLDETRILQTVIPDVTRPGGASQVGTAPAAGAQEAAATQLRTETEKRNRTDPPTSPPTQPPLPGRP